MKFQPLIIVVDNDPEDRAFIRHSFMQVQQGCNVEFLTSGAELLQYLYEADPYRYPDLVVLDYNMPEMNGKDTLREIKNNPFIARIPVLVYSTSVTPGMRMELAAYNVLNCIEKSTSEARLIEQARYFLELVAVAN